MSSSPYIEDLPEKKPKRFSFHHSPISTQNRELAEQNFLRWEGVQTRDKFIIKEEEVTEWIEQITRKPLGANTPEELAEALSDGYVLCELANCLLNDDTEIPKNPEKRVKRFLKQCRGIGVAKALLFDSPDLLLKRNTVKVVYCLHALAEECHTKKLAPFFTGAGKEERQQKRGDWIKKARQSMRKGLKVADGFNLEAPAIAPMDGGAGVFPPVPPTPDKEDEGTFLIPEPISPEPQPPSQEVEPPRRAEEKRSPFANKPAPVQPAPAPVPVHPPQTRQVIERKKPAVPRAPRDLSLLKLCLFWGVCLALWTHSFLPNAKSVLFLQ